MDFVYSWYVVLRPRNYLFIASSKSQRKHCYRDIKNIPIMINIPKIYDVVDLHFLNMDHRNILIGDTCHSSGLVTFVLLMFTLYSFTDVCIKEPIK